MAFIPLTTDETNPNRPITSTLWTKVKDNFDALLQRADGALPAIINLVERARALKQTNLLIPLYLYPTDVENNSTWNTLIDLITEHHDVPTMVIINPDNGPGSNRAVGTLTVTANPADGETVIIDVKTYTFKTSVGAGTDGLVLIGADANATLVNLQAGMNLEAGAGTKYGANMLVHPSCFGEANNNSTFTAEARVFGSAGDLLATTETLANGSWGAATLLGGDIQSVDPNFETLIKRLKGAGATVLGYVTVRTTIVPIATIKADIDEWRRLYPAINGIFFDKMGTDSGQAFVDYYVALTSHIHSAGFFPSIGNPGTPLGAAQAPLWDSASFDIAVVWEASTFPAENVIKDDVANGMIERSLSNKAGLVHSISNLKTNLAGVSLLRKYVGMIYVTDDTPPNLWVSLPPYLAELFFRVRGLNRSPSAPTAPTNGQSAIVVSHRSIVITVQAPPDLDVDTIEFWGGTVNDRNNAATRLICSVRGTPGENVACTDLELGAIGTSKFYWARALGEGGNGGGDKTNGNWFPGVTNGLEAVVGSITGADVSTTSPTAVDAGSVVCTATFIPDSQGGSGGNVTVLATWELTTASAFTRHFKVKLREGGVTDKDDTKIVEFVVGQTTYKQVWKGQPTGQTFDVKVKVFDLFDNKSTSVTSAVCPLVEDNVAPDPPTSVVVTTGTERNATTGQVQSFLDVVWVASIGDPGPPAINDVAFHRVKIVREGAGKITRYITGATDTAFRILDLPPGVTYTVTVKARDKSNNGSTDITASGSPITVALNTDRPAAGGPATRVTQGVQADSVTGNVTAFVKVRAVAYPDNADELTGIKFKGRLNGGNWNDIESIKTVEDDDDATSITDATFRGLNTNTAYQFKYKYQTRRQSDKPNSPWSTGTDLEVTTTAAGAPSNINPVPTHSTGISVDADPGDTSPWVEVNWTAPTPGDTPIDFYKVKLTRTGTPGLDDDKKAKYETDGDDTSLLIEGLALNTTYIVEVRPWNKSGLKSGSWIAAATTVVTPKRKGVGAFNVKNFGAIGDGVIDDTAAIQAAIDAATAAATGTQTRSINTVKVPDGDYKITTQLVVKANVDFNCKGILFNNLTDKWQPAIHFLPGSHCRRLHLWGNLGSGVQFGSPGISSDMKIGTVRLWNIGEEFDAGKTPPSKTGVLFNGFNFEFEKFQVDGGNIGLDINAASDVRGNGFLSFTASTAVRITSGCEHLFITGLDIDTPGFKALQIDSSSDIVITGSIFINDQVESPGPNGMENAIVIGQFSGANKVKNLSLKMNVQNTGLDIANDGDVAIDGTALQIWNCVSSTIELNITNAPMETRPATWATNQRPIKDAVEYVSGVEDDVNITCTIDARTTHGGVRINPSIGTPVGTLDFTGLSVPDQPAAPTLETGIDSDGTDGTASAFIEATGVAFTGTDLEKYIFKLRLVGAANWKNAKREESTEDDEDGFAHINTFRPLVKGQAYECKYKIVTRRRSIKHVSPWSAIATKTAGQDGDAPGLPTNLVVTPTYKTLFSTWTNPTDADFSHIEIWRHTSDVQGSATKIAESKTTFYSDSSIDHNVTRYYWLKSVDDSGNVSAFNQAAGVSQTTKKVLSGDIQVVQLSDIAGNVGILNLGLIQDGAGNMTIDITNATITVKKAGGLLIDVVDGLKVMSTGGIFLNTTGAEGWQIRPVGSGQRIEFVPVGALSRTFSIGTNTARVDNVDVHLNGDTVDKFLVIAGGSAKFAAGGGGIGFFSSGTVAKQTVAGTPGGGTNGIILKDLLVALENYGLINATGVP